MASLVRLLLAPVAFGLLLGGVALAAPSLVAAASPRVVMIDNDAPVPAQGFDPRTGEWGFAPHRLVVTRGEVITFDNPSSNHRPHDVVSIAQSGTPFQPTLEAGTHFVSATSRETLTMPGQTWQLDTGALDPGHYTYYCSLHPWMVGTLTVTPNE